MKWSMSSVAILVAALSSVAVGAQSGAAMTKGDKMDKVEMMDSQLYRLHRRRKHCWHVRVDACRGG